jgi:hypothetical protein
MNEYSLTSEDVKTPVQGHTIEVEVLMFGMICQTTGEAKTSLQLPCNATVGDAIAALGERYGAEFINQVMRTAAAKASHTQISVGGCLVRDLVTPLASGKGATTVEIILLSGHEGG